MSVIVKPVIVNTPGSELGAVEVPGIRGPVGDTGSQGPTGPQGPEGPTGPQGPAGADGADGLGVPAGGSTGQVLTKSSEADNDTLWADSAGGGGTKTTVIPNLSGKWTLPGWTGIGNAYITVLRRRILYSPILVSSDRSFDALGIDSANAFDSKLRVGLYSCPNDCSIGSLLHDFGTFDLNVTGPQQLAISPEITLEPGLYWVASIGGDLGNYGLRSASSNISGPSVMMSDAIFGNSEKNVPYLDVPQATSIDYVENGLPATAVDPTDTTQVTSACFIRWRIA